MNVKILFDCGKWLLLVMLVACAPTQPEGVARHLAPDTVAVELPDLTPTPYAIANLRIINISDKTFESMVVRSTHGKAEYGNVPSNGMSEYQPIEALRRYGYITITDTAGTTYEWIPIDYVGEVMFPAGDYSYVIDIDESGNEYDQIQQAYIDENDWFVDEKLVGQGWDLIGVETAEGQIRYPVSDPEWSRFAINFRSSTKDPSLYDPSLCDPPCEPKQGYSFSAINNCRPGEGRYLVNESNQLIITDFTIAAMGCYEGDKGLDSIPMSSMDNLSYYRVQGDFLRVVTRNPHETVLFVSQRSQRDSHQGVDWIVPAVMQLWNRWDENREFPFLAREEDWEGVDAAVWQFNFYDEPLSILSFTDGTALNAYIEDVNHENSWILDAHLLVVYEGDDERTVEWIEESLVE